MSNVAPEAGPEIITLAELFTRQGRQEGVEQGRQEGAVEERRAWVLKLLELRFAPLPETTRQRVQDAPADELDVWAERVLAAESLDTVLDG